MYIWQHQSAHLYSKTCRHPFQTWIPSSTGTQLPSFVWAMDNPGLTVHGIHSSLLLNCDQLAKRFRITFAPHSQTTTGWHMRSIHINSYQLSLQPQQAMEFVEDPSPRFFIENSKLMTLRILHRLEGPILRSLTFKPWPKITSQVDPSWSKVQST